MRFIPWEFQALRVSFKTQYFPRITSSTLKPYLRQRSLIDFFSRRSTSAELTTQSSFGGYEVESLAPSAHRAPHRQRLLLFRYSRMNERNQNRYETLIRQPLAAEQSPNMFSRTGSLDSPPVAPPRKFHLRKEAQYQSMVEDNSIDDSDGSNMTSITTTTTGD